MAVCQTDGLLFRDMAVVALIAETIEEIVPVAYLETFFAFGVLQRLAEVELHLQVDGRRILLHGEERGSFSRIFALLVLHSSSVGNVTFTVSGFTFSSRSGREESIRIVRHEESASRIAPAGVYFGIEQLFILAACQGVHAVVIAFEGVKSTVPNAFSSVRKASASLPVR